MTMFRPMFSISTISTKYYNEIISCDINLV